MFKMLDELTIDDLFNKEHPHTKIVNTIDGYNATYDQAWCGIHRLVGITKLLTENKIVIRWNHLYRYMKFEIVDDTCTEKELLKVLFDTFAFNPNFIVTTWLEVVTTQRWIDEDYNDCRLRNLWEVMDELELDKRGGYGNFISQKKILKYYRPKGKSSEDGTLPLDLD